MTEKAQHEVAAGVPLRRLADALFASRPVRAVAVAVSILLLLLWVLLATPLAGLHQYLAVIAAFLIVIVLPGYVVQRAVLHDSALDLVARLPVAVAMGLAIAAVPGFIALEAHTDLQAFAVMYSFTAAVACGAAVALMRPANEERRGEDPSERWGSPIILVMVAVAFGGVLTAPFWAKGRLAADFDDWTYMAYIRDYLDTNSLNSSEPYFGTDEGVNPRMRSNVWVLTEALLSDAADVAPDELLFEYLRPVLIVAAVLATYALAMALFRHRVIGLLAMGFLLGHAFLDLSPHEGFGRNLLLRISEDKMIAAFLLFPVAVVFLSRFVQQRSRASYAGFSLVVLALAVVHPVPLMLLGTTIAALGAIKLYLERSPRTLGILALLLIPLALASIWPVIQRQLLVDAVPDVFDTGDSSVTFRDNFHVVRVGLGLLMGNYHMILHPLVILAVLVVPVLWRLTGRSHSAQIVLAMTAGALLVFFVPLLATPVAEVMTPQTLWKMPWMIPAAPVLACVAYRAVLKLHGAQRLRWLFGGRVRGGLALAALPAGALVLVLAAALVVQEQYVRADNGDFYNWTSTRTVVPGSDLSVFRGGVDRAFSTQWRLAPEEQRLLEYMQRRMPPGSVVLIDPWLVNHLVPGVLTDIYPVDFGGNAGEGQRRADVEAFSSGQLNGVQLEDIVDRWGVDYIVVIEVGAANASLEQFPRARWIEEIAPFAIYEVDP